MEVFLVGYSVVNINAIEWISKKATLLHVDVQKNCILDCRVAQYLQPHVPMNDERAKSGWWCFKKWVCLKIRHIIFFHV